MAIDPARTSRRPHDVFGTAVALLMIGLGIVLIAGTGGMSPLGSVFPITISAAMIVVCSILIVRNVVLGLRRTGGSRNTAVDEQKEAAGSMGRRLLFLACMAFWVFTIPLLGFFVASLFSYFAIMATATHERMSAKEMAVLLVIGIAILSGFYTLMANVLLIPMPGGLFF